MKKAKVSKYGQWKYPGQDTIIPNANGSITMKGVPYPVLGIDDQGNQQMMMPGGEYQFPGNSVYEIPMAKKGGAKKVKIKSLPKAQGGGTWDEYLKTVGAKDPRFLKLTQEEVDAMFDSSGSINSDIVNRYKQTNKEGENDIRVDTYNTALKSLLDDYNKIYPKGNDGSRSLIKNAANLFTSYTTSADGKTVTLGDGANSIKLTPEEFDKFKYSKELDPKKNKEFFDAYIKNQKKWTSTDPAESGSEYRNVPTTWVDATPKYDLKGIDHPGVDDSEFNMDMRGMFRHPVFYDDKTLGKENMPLLYTTGMANEYNGSILQREEHYNPAIYPKPSYSIKGVEPVISGRPSWGASATINGQQYTVGAPTQNSNFDQFYSIPASAMPGPSAENVFVDTPDSVWMQNYKNKMNLYDVTQQNLARLKEYDPNYNVVTNYDVSDPRYDPYQKFDKDPSNTRTDEYNKRMEGYEQRYIDDPSVGFYQAGPNEEINEPCVGCGTLYGSKKSADANTTYRTYDVQYPEKGIYSKKDLERAKEHYTIKESGNPGQSYLWKYTDDGKGGYNQELQGSVFTRDFLNDEQQVQYDAPTGGSWVVDYDPAVHKVYQDQRDVTQTIEGERGVKQNAQNNLNREQQRIKEENAARELWEKQQREKQNKRIAGANGQYAYGGGIDPDKPKIDFTNKTKSSDENYITKQIFYDNNTAKNKNRRTLKGFITGAPKPGEPGGPPKFAMGGIPRAQAIGIKKPNFNQTLSIPLQFQQAPNFMDVHVAMPKNSGFGDFTTHRVPTVYDAVRSGNPSSMEEAVDKYLGYPMDKAYAAADRLAPEGEDPIDSFRHPAAAMYTQQAIKDRVGVPILGDALGFLGANASGIGHEVSTLFKDERPWDIKLREAGEDAFNNLTGSVVGLLPGTQDEKANLIYDMSLSNWLPDGIVSKDPNKNMYLKDEQGNVNRDSAMDMYNRMFQKKQGGVIKQVRIKSLPKAQRGLATAADSSYVAAGANAPHNFYKSNGYDIGIVPNTSSGTFFNLGMNEAEDNKWETGNVFDRLAIARKNYEKWGKSESNIDAVTNQPIPYNDYTTYKPGTHRFEQRELAIGLMNANAPRSKYDDRIMPQRMAQYDNWETGDSATVPVYDKLAVTPWKELSDKQKIQRLQYYGGSGTPYSDKASIKQAIEDLKNPIPRPKMKEASLLPLPKVEIDLQPQLPAISNPYPPKPETEYFIMPSGNPGVGVIHARTYDGKGGYKEKVIGPSLARDWFNDADQKEFDTRDMSSRIDYDPRDKDPDHKIYADMYSATQEIEKLRQQEKEAQKPKKTPEVRTSKPFKFLTGGLTKKKKQPGFQVLTDANGKYVFVKT